jgi:hypothetical protein
MKTIEVHPLLTELQYPWNICSHDKRDEIISKLPYSQENLHYAIDLFNRSISVIIDMPEPETNLIPEDKLEYWPLENELIGRSLSTLSDMNIDVIEKCIDGSESDENFSKIQEQVLIYWSWSNIRGICGTSARFIGKYLEYNEDEHIARAFIEILSRSWQKLDKYYLRSLLRSVYHAKKYSIPLLHEIQNKAFDEQTQTVAKGFEELVQWEINNSQQ